MSKSSSESSYAKRQRRRAERIIAATGCYSAAFRAEVQAALDRLPHKLPTLFREAERVDSRLETAGREIRMKARAAGLPLGGGRSRTMQRSPRKFIQRLADEVESVMIQHEAEQLTEQMAERAQTISGILFDIGNEAGVSATHPTIIKGYMQAIYDRIPELEQRDYEYVQRAFEHIQDLLNGCSEARFEEIHRAWNKHLYRDEESGNDHAARDIKAEPAPELVNARAKLASLENLPENEAVRFHLESEIHRLEREAESTDEWPEVIRVQA